MIFKIKFPVEEKGGPGSGFHGHSGRPGKVGGSSGGGTGSSFPDSPPANWDMFAGKLLRQRKTSKNRFVVATISHDAGAYNLKLNTRSEESGFSTARGNKKGYNFNDFQEAVSAGNAWITDETLPA